jgi:DNA-binding XRE family transcriptional regulator
MSGRNSFKGLTSDVSAERLERIEAHKSELREQMSLAELRHARRLTQETLGQTLNVGQSAVAKMENRADIYVSNLRRYIEAMGGVLEIVAHFPDGDVQITNFADIEPVSSDESQDHRLFA